MVDRAPQRTLRQDEEERAGKAFQFFKYSSLIIARTAGEMVSSSCYLTKGDPVAAITRSHRRVISREEIQSCVKHAQKGKAVDKDK